VNATLSVVTSAVDSLDPLPFDRWAIKNKERVSPEAWRPVSWDEIEECLNSGLVTLGSHSHQHLNADTLSEGQIEEEVALSAETLYTRFGVDAVPVYAYPFGNTYLGHVPGTYESAVRRAGFSIAVTTDYGRVTRNCNPLMLPRIEVHDLDTAASLRAKIAGRLSPFRVHDHIRSVAHQIKSSLKKRSQITQTAG
jgi:peptidoglycan/xylan/chitin deacetylase (PgdA/CDA1 family)